MYTQVTISPSGVKKKNEVGLIHLKEFWGFLKVPLCLFFFYHAPCRTLIPRASINFSPPKALPRGWREFAVRLKWLSRARATGDLKYLPRDMLLNIITLYIKVYNMIVVRIKIKFCCIQKMRIFVSFFVEAITSISCSNNWEAVAVYIKDLFILDAH